MNTQSQCQTIKAHMKRCGAITSMQAFRLYSITRLSGRILDLRRRGCKIKTKLIDTGTGSKYARYSLA